MPAALAVDIGGTKMAAGIVTTSGGVLEQRAAPTAGASDGDELFERLADLITDLDGGPSGDEPVDLEACGVGCGGPMEPGGEAVSPLNIEVWRDFPLRSRLREATGLPTWVDNDAKALALGEGWIGAAAGNRDFLAMVVSTGVGGGVVVDGRLLHGAGGNAGHIGHVIVEPDGRACACGAQGCLEAEAAGPSIAAATGRPPEQADMATIERTGTLVGRGVASVVNLLDLPLATVAGSVALGFGAPFFAAAQAELDRSCRLEFARGARIVPAGLGGEGPLVGAAAVGFSGQGRSLLG